MTSEYMRFVYEFSPGFTAEVRRTGVEPLNLVIIHSHIMHDLNDELCEYHGQPGDEMKTFWKKLVEGSYGVPSYPENSDISDTS